MLDAFKFFFKWHDKVNKQNYQLIFMLICTLDGNNSFLN